MRYMKGDRLFLDAAILPVGELQVGKKASLTAYVRNMSDQERVIVGAKPSCDCAVVHRLPEVLPPHSRTPIRIEIGDNIKPGRFSERLVLFTDDAGQPRMTIRLEGQVVATSHP